MSNKGSFGIVKNIIGNFITVIDKKDVETIYELTENWKQYLLYIEEYDEVFIESSDNQIIDNSSIFVINPRYLVSVTETLKAISCPRKVYVRHMGASSSYDPILHQRQVKGNLLHDVFTHKLVHGSTIRDAIDSTLEKNSFDLILADFDKQTARRYLNEDAMTLQAFSFDGKSEMDVKHYGHGLVGKLDGITSTDMIIELKSSKIPDSTPWPNHNIQMNIYQDMMEDYLDERPKGKVLYVSDNQFSIKNPTKWSTMTTIMARNWAYLVLSGRYIPEILRGEDKKTCRNCYRKKGCLQLCAKLIQQRDCDACFHNKVCHKTAMSSEKIDFFKTQTSATIFEELEMKVQEYFGHRYSFSNSENIDKITAKKIKEDTDPFGNFVTEFSHMIEDTRFRNGDLVTIFPPEVKKSTEISFGARIVDITGKTILLRSGNSLPKQVDIYPSTTSVLIRRNRESLYKSIQSESPLINLVIQSVTSSASVKLETLTPKHSKIIDPLLDYNSEQNRAIQMALATPDLLLIQGPAGTGKTSVIVEIVNQLVKREKSILISAFTNMAVDNVALQLHKHEIDFIRIGSKYRMHPTIQSYNIEEKIDAFKRFTEKRTGRVILATTSTIGRNTFDDLFFDYVLIDEAAQMKIPDTLASLLHAEKAILVGDHAQLQPIVVSEKAINLGFEKSLFERLVHISSRFVLLTHQYRMSDEILLLPNRLFYENKLQSATNIIANQNIVSKSELIIESSYQVIAIENKEHNNYSQSNDLEAIVTIKLISDLVESSEYGPDDIGIICPFRAQVALLRRYLPDFNIDTIDRFQGSEADIIIFNSTTMVDIPLLSDSRRVNVALTRARKKLIVLQTNPSQQIEPTLMREIYRDANNRNCLITLRENNLHEIQLEVDKYLEKDRSMVFEYNTGREMEYNGSVLIYYNSIPLFPVKLDETERCLICYQQIEKGLQCPGCGYLYHETQLRKWVNDNRSCPTCKHRLDLVNVV